MQQRPQSGPSTGFNFLLAGALGVFGLISLIDGVRGGAFGIVLKGVALLVYAAMLLRDALHIKKTGQPAMTRRRMNQIGLACLALYFIGVLANRGPELAQMLG